MSRMWMLTGVVLLLLMIAEAGWAQGRQRFTGSPTQLDCRSVGLQKAGGDPGGVFQIELQARCHVNVWVDEEDDYRYLDTWTVNVSGSYDYRTRKARERLSRQGDTIQDAIVTCTQNPWAHALFCDASTVQVVASEERTAVVGQPPVTAPLVGGELRTSLAGWESASSDDLDDWNPYQPQTEAQVAIIQPAGHVALEGGVVPLELQAVTPLHSTHVELQWARIVKSKDPSLGAETWLEDQPENAPTEVEWGTLPTTVPIAGVFDVGSYAVRARMQGDPESSWSEWRRFVVSGSNIRRGVVRPVRP